MSRNAERGGGTNTESPLAADLLLYLLDGRVTKDLLRAYYRDRGIRESDLPPGDLFVDSTAHESLLWESGFDESEESHCRISGGENDWPFDEDEPVQDEPVDGSDDTPNNLLEENPLRAGEKKQFATRDEELFETSDERAFEALDDEGIFTKDDESFEFLTEMPLEALHEDRIEGFSEASLEVPLGTPLGGRAEEPTETSGDGTLSALGGAPASTDQDGRPEDDGTACAVETDAELGFKRMSISVPQVEISLDLPQRSRPPASRIAIAAGATIFLAVLGAVLAMHDPGSDLYGSSEQAGARTVSDTIAVEAPQTPSRVENLDFADAARNTAHSDRSIAGSAGASASGVADTPIEEIADTASVANATPGAATARDRGPADETVGVGKHMQGMLRPADPQPNNGSSAGAAEVVVYVGPTAEGSTPDFRHLFQEQRLQKDRQGRLDPHGERVAALIIEAGLEPADAETAAPRGTGLSGPLAGASVAIEEPPDRGTRVAASSAGRAPAPPQSKPIIDSPSGIRQIQQMLADLGYNVGPADGVYGPRTREATKAYQARYGLAADGKPTRFLADRLEASLLWQRSLQAFNRKNYEEAIVGFSRLIELRPDSADVVFNRGLSLQRVGRLADAETDFRAALALDPGHSQAHLSLANLMLAKGRYLDAAGQYLKTAWSWF